MWKVLRPLALSPPRLVGILGLGLMGSSLGLALRKSGISSKILGWDRVLKVRTEAYKKGAVDQLVQGQAGLGAVDILVLSVPPAEVVACLRKIRPHLKQKTLIMDLSSVRGRLHGQAALVLGSHANFYVGAHPIAGSEHSGPGASKADLYKGAAILLVAPSRPPSGVLSRCKKFWKQIGSHCLVLKARDHDLLVAYTSHLPHIVASSLRQSVLPKKAGPLTAAKILGPGFRDTTRIAFADSDLWADILWQNRRPILRALRDYEASLSLFKKALSQEGIQGSRLLRRALIQGRKG